MAADGYIDTPRRYSSVTCGVRFCASRRDGLSPEREGAEQELRRMGWRPVGAGYGGGPWCCPRCVPHVFVADGLLSAVCPDCRMPFTASRESCPECVGPHLREVSHG